MGIAINVFGFLSFALWFFLLWRNIREAKDLKKKYRLPGWPTLNTIEGIGTAESAKDYLRLKAKARREMLFWTLYLIGGFVLLILLGVFLHRYS